MRRPQRATALASAPLQLCPHRARAAEPTPCPSEFRRAGFRAQMLDGYRGDSVPRSFLTRKFDKELPSPQDATSFLFPGGVKRL